MSITYAQTVLLQLYDPEIQVKTQAHPRISAWILYQVMIFYFNLGAQFIFLVASRIVSFRTLAERHDFGGNKRYQIDWLDFVKDDIHWFNILIIEIGLCIYGNSVRAHRDIYNNTTTLILVIIQLFFAAYVVY